MTKETMTENREQATTLLLANKAVHATILEFDDLFRAITEDFDSGVIVSRKVRCDICTKHTRCVMHPSDSDRRDMFRSIMNTFAQSNHAHDLSN